MHQIKNYLSQIYDLQNVWMLVSTQEFEELSNWLMKTGKAKKIFRSVPEDQEIDAVIFDYQYGEQVEQLPIKEVKHLVGRIRSDEDYFGIWENGRKIATAIYIEQDKDLQSEIISTDCVDREVLFWKKRETDIELSIIIPVCNVAQYLPRCIESIINWKASYIEYLFVNDGSTDCSEEIIKNYAENDNRIRLINKDNGGCASARNRGIDEARGRYIGFVDADDFIDEMMFFKLFRRALMGNYDLTYCGYQECYEDTGRVEPVKNDCLTTPYLEGTYRADKVQLLAVKTRVAIWRCLYKKDLLDRSEIRFHEDLKRFDDLPFRVEYIFLAQSAVCIPEYLYYYRLGRKGQDTECTDKRLFVHFTIFEHLDKYVDVFKDNRLQDLLQIVKIQTHGYALSKIQRQYRKEYIKLARKQLDRNMGYFRTVCLIMMYTGKGNLGWYTRMKIRI